MLALICLLELPITLQENKPRSLLKVLNLSCDPYSVEKEKKDPGNNLMTVACLVAKHRSRETAPEFGHWAKPPPASSSSAPVCHLTA